MKNIVAVLLGVFSITAFADPSVKNVQVNIHNSTQHTVEFLTFDSDRIFASTRFAEPSIAPSSSVDNAIFFASFDKEPMIAGVNVLINGEPMKLMWQTNMGFGGPDDPKFHICGVIKDNKPRIDQEYCHIPYVTGNTLVIDFNIE